jgi:glycosyltransferase involved in cell wall biosynthesis
MSRPSLLFLSHRLPYPPHNGAALRTYNIIRLLARDFDLHVLCFDRADKATAAMPLAERTVAMAEFGTFEVFPIPQQRNRGRFVADHARSVIHRVPYTYYVYDSVPFERRLRKLIADRQFSLVHMDSMDLVRFLPLLSGLPVACTHHNVESVLMRRRAENEESSLVRRYLAHQAALLEEAERDWLPRIALNIAASDADRNALQAIAPAARIATVPNGVDTDFFTPGDVAQPQGCVFVGGTTWYPNRDALEWYVSDVAPAAQAIGVTAPVTWVGRAADEELERFADDPALHLTGYVDDVRPYVHGAKCFIVPLRVGGGTRLKILDAWAMGAAVVSTSIGCEGLAAVDGENILIADSAEEFAGTIARVLLDDSLRRTLGANARRTAVERYSWDVLGMAMRDLYIGLAAVSHEGYS